MDNNIYRQTKKYFSKLGFFYLAITLMIFLVQSGIIYLVSYLNPALLNNNDLFMLISMLPTHLVMLLFVLLVIKTIPAVPVAVHTMTAGQMTLAFFMSYALTYIGNLAGVITTWGIGILKGSSVGNPIVDTVTGMNPLTTLLLMVVLAPVVEELVFRKLIVDRLVRYGEGAAILFSALFFGLFHGNLNQFVYAFLLGLFWAFIYTKTGKIIYTMILHSIINFIGSVASLLVTDSLSSVLDIINTADTQLIMRSLSEHLAELILFLLYTFAILAIVITGIVLLALNSRKFRCAPGEIIIPKGKRFSTMVLNPGVLLYIIIWGALIIQQLLM